jgi:DNA polymerase-1
MAAGTDDDGGPKAWRVEFEPKANQVIRAFEAELEPRLAEGEDLWSLCGWGGKAAGGAVRIATTLHLAEAAGREGHRLTPVPAVVAERAVRLVRDYLVPHAQAAFGVLAADERITRARRVVKWFTGHGLTRFSVRDANRAMKGSIRTVDELTPVLDLIERHHYIRQKATDRGSGAGRPRSPTYEVNPEALDGKGNGEDSSGGRETSSESNSGDNGEPEGGNWGRSPTRSHSGDRSLPDARKPGKTSTDDGLAPTLVEPQLGFGDIGNIDTQWVAAGPVPTGSEQEGSLPAEGVSPNPDSQYPQNPAPPNRGNIGDFGDIEPPSALRTYGVADSVPHEGAAAAGHNSQNPQNGRNVEDSAAIRASATAIPNPTIDPHYPRNQLTSETGDPSGYDGRVAPETPYLLVRTADELSLVVNAVAESRLVGLDCETTGLDPRHDRVRLLSLDCETIDGGRFTYLVDAFAVDPRTLWGPLADAEVVAHNASFDLAFLARLGFEAGRVHDTLLLSHVLHASARMRGVAPLRHGLKDCCQRELGITLDKDLQASDWTGALSSEQLAYAAADASVLVALYQAVTARLKEAGLDRAAAIESTALPCIVWLGSSGVPFDRDRWRDLGRTARDEAERITAELNAIAPARPDTLFAEPWNWDSPEQVQRALELAGCPVESTADGVLAAIDHPLAKLLRDHRDARKRETTYGEAWLSHVAADGRVYPRWVQLGANSGRMACGSPNMQNLPRGEYRKCVAAPPGRVLVKADYSQIELRIAAKISGDKALIAAYERGEDLHTLTARQVLGIAEVTKQHRQLAKAINFGLLYGMGAKSFRSYARTNYGVEMTEAEAHAYREAFFNAYPGLRRWHRSIRDGATDTRTLVNRRVTGVEHFTEKLNLPVQGTGADGLKTALGLLWARRHEVSGAVPVLAVHDEIVVEAAEAEAGKVAEWLKRCMADAMAPLVAPIPVEVEVKIGKNWGVD